MRPSDLDPERWRRIDAILEEALEIPVRERARFLDEACAGDDELRSQVGALLEAHARAGARFDRPATPLGAAILASSEPLPRDRQRVGRFRLLREIGRGGMGVVYLAEDTRLGRHVALKALPPYLGVGREARRRFESEARAVSALDHPNIATLYEIGETDEGQLYMVFAFYEGETLESRIDRGPLSVAETIEIATGLAAGLAAAHENGIIHRDVKPSNVLLTGDGGVKLLDFGVAKVAGEDVTREGVRMGTLAYMSPEQAGGAPIDPRTDLWSLGVVLYEMLTGERPFRGANHASLIQSILHDDPRAPDSAQSELPEVVGRVVEKLLCKAPEGRYASAEALQGDLRAIEAGKPPMATREVARWTHRVPVAAWRSLRRRPWRPLPALVLGLAVVAGGLWLAANPPGAGEARIERLAVMPFENRTGDPEQQHLVDGIHEALIAQLGGIAALRIIPGTPAMSDGGGVTSVQEIARALNVDALVDGSVFRDGDRLTVATRLRAVSPETIMVAESHEGDAGEVLEIARRVARSIAAEIDAPLSAAEEARLAAPARVSPEAYEAYSWGRFHIERRDEEGIELARNYFQTAIDADPTFALAYAGLADTYSQAGNWGLARPSETFSQARALAEMALRIDSTVAEAYTSLASVSFLYEWDWEETERLARKAIELNPSFVPAYERLSQVMTVMGRREELWAERERAQALRHLPLQSDMASAFGAYLQGDFDQVIERSREAREFDSGLWQASWLICMALAHEGLHREAIRECEGAAARFEGNPMVLGGLGHAYASAGMRAEAERVVREMAELAREVYVGPTLRAFIYAALGDRDRAFEWLDRAVDERDVLLVRVDFPFFDPLRTDPRFAALLERMGIERR